MHADRYQSKKLDGGSLGLSVSIVGGLVAAAMLSTTVIEAVTQDKPLTTYWVKPTPPPPPEVKPEVRQEPNAPARIDRPEVIVPTQPTELRVVLPDPGPPVDLTPGEGAGAGTVVLDPPKPPVPVLTRADVDPRYARDFQPVYPAEERRAGNEGVVSLRVLIGVDGRVRQVERLMAPSDAFWRATEQRALAKWRFKPATRDGIPYETWRPMTVRFRLEE